MATHKHTRSTKPKPIAPSYNKGLCPQNPPPEENPAMGLSRHLHAQIRPKVIGGRKHRGSLMDITANMGLNYDTVRYEWKERHLRGDSGKVIPMAGLERH